MPNPLSPQRSGGLNLVVKEAVEIGFKRVGYGEVAL
jgi:hypothetical protein